jgi:hypothetical protein
MPTLLALLLALAAAAAGQASAATNCPSTAGHFELLIDGHASTAH